MIWFFSTEGLKNEIPPAGGVVFHLRKICHAGSEDCRSGFCWREKWRIWSVCAPPQMWITAVGMNGICLFRHRAHFSQGAACNKLDNGEDDEAGAGKPNAFCSRCSPGCMALAPTPLPQHPRKVAQQRTCAGSGPTASKLLHFGIVPATESCEEDIDGSFFYWILSLKKAPVTSMSITLKCASFRTNRFLSPFFISQILQGELHWLPVLLSSKHRLRPRPGMPLFHGWAGDSSSEPRERHHHLPLLSSPRPFARTGECQIGCLLSKASLMCPKSLLNHG